VFIHSLGTTAYYISVNLFTNVLVPLVTFLEILLIFRICGYYVKFLTDLHEAIIFDGSE
jgi:hypothetical protein